VGSTVHSKLENKSYYSFLKSNTLSFKKPGTTSPLGIHLCSPRKLNKPAFKNHTRSPQRIRIFFFFAFHKNNHGSIAVLHIRLNTFLSQAICTGWCITRKQGVQVQGQAKPVTFSNSPTKTIRTQICLDQTLVSVFHRNNISINLNQAIVFPLKIFRYETK